MKTRTGLFGGSFNPIHIGHLHLAQAVQAELQLDGILLMPAGEAPHKSSAAYAPAVDRFHMCELAAAQIPQMRVSDYEMRKRGKSYTVETLRYLTQVQPQTDWTLLIGSDMLLTFDAWVRWEEILSMAAVAAVSRQAGDLPQLHEKADALRRSCPAAEIHVLSVDAVEISSTEIREKLQKGADCSCVLPENVVQYIQEHGLYQA